MVCGEECEALAGDVAVSLLFGVGGRPTASQIVELTHGRSGFSVGPECLGGQIASGRDQPICVELLAEGLSFDLVGLGGGLPADPNPVFLPIQGQGPLETIALRTGPHLLSSGQMRPVLRCLAWLGSQLAQLDGVQAVHWHPTGRSIKPAYFQSAVARWLEGGASSSLELGGPELWPAEEMESVNFVSLHQAKLTQLTPS